MGRGGEDVNQVYHCREVRAYVEDHKVVGSIMLDTAESGCMKGSEVWACGSEVSL